MQESSKNIQLEAFHVFKVEFEALSSVMQGHFDSFYSHWMARAFGIKNSVSIDLEILYL